MKINTKGPSVQKHLSPLNRNLLKLLILHTRPAVFQSPRFLVLPSNLFTQSLLMKAEMGNCGNVSLQQMRRVLDSLNSTLQVSLG